jgi:hypothetical protein
MKGHHPGLVGVVLFTMLSALSAPAHAQALVEQAKRLIEKVGVHGNVSFRNPTDPDVSKGMTLGPSVGLAPGLTNGWKYPFGITMFSEDLHSPNGEQFATLKTKAILVGIGYGWHFGRLATGISLQTGYAFNSGQIDGDMLRAFDVPDGAVSIDAGNAPLLRPQVKGEYFLTPKFTFRVSADYMWLRPDVVVTTPLERLANRWDASNIHANVGVGFYPFRKE